MLRQFLGDNSPEENVLLRETETTCTGIGGCPGVPVHEGIPFVFITIHGVMTQFVNVSFFCVPVHEDTTDNLFVYYEVKVLADKFTYGLQTVY